MSRLPIELWCNILNEINNPLDLIKLRTVCRDWNAEINRLLPYANWKKLCLTKIRAFPLTSIITIIDPKLRLTNYRNIQDQSFWQSVYYHYKKWSNVINSPVRVLGTTNALLLSADEHVTCCDVWFNWIAYGTNQGRIKIFPDFNYKHPNRVIFFDYDDIQEIKFWYNDAKILFLVSQTKSHIIRFWNMMYKEETSTNLVFPGDKFCTGTAHNFYSAFYNSLVKFGIAGRDSVEIKTTLQLELASGEKIVAMTSRESKIFVATRKILVVRLFTIEDEFLSKNSDTLHIQSILLTPSLPVESLNFQVYVTLNRTIICTRGALMSINSSEFRTWITHNIWIFLRGYVTSFIVHGNYLIIGLSNGSLCMHYVDSINDLQSFNLFDKNRLKIFQLSTLPIIAIKITQIFEEIYVIVVTKLEMFILNV